LRKRILYFDLHKIDNDIDPLADSELEVKKRLFCSKEEDLFIRLDIEEGLKALTEKQRECFLLFSEGYTYREIAQKFSLSLPTVQQHINYAKQKLREFLD
jgi:RNA polymerase sigma factor (sigma-70 family)